MTIAECGMRKIRNPQSEIHNLKTMDFKLTSEQEMIRDMVRDFTEKNIKPVAALYDEEKQFPYQNLKRMADLGLMGMNLSLIHI